MTRNHPASMPGYEPPHDTHLFFSVRPKAAVACAWKVARSASAWRDESHLSGCGSAAEYGHADALWQP